MTVPNKLWDREKTDGLYQEYIDQLVYGEELGFDGLVLNEHHQNIYGLMPSPNIIAAVKQAIETGCRVVTLSGFREDNPLRQSGKLNWYIKSPEYGFVEIAHLVICHTILDIEMGWTPRN